MGPGLVSGVRGLHELHTLRIPVRRSGRPLAPLANSVARWGVRALCRGSYLQPKVGPIATLLGVLCLHVLRSRRSSRLRTLQTKAIVPGFPSPNYTPERPLTPFAKTVVEAAPSHLRHRSHRQPVAQPVTRVLARKLHLLRSVRVSCLPKTTRRASLCNHVALTTVPLSRHHVAMVGVRCLHTAHVSSNWLEQRVVRGGGWVWCEALTVDENYLDLAFLLSHQSTASGRVGCAIVRGEFDGALQTPSGPGDLLMLGVNSSLFTLHRADCHAEANAIAESASFG